MCAADFPARCFGLLGCHAVDMQQATEFPLILIFAGLGIFHNYREARESPGGLVWELCTEVYRWAFLLRPIQGQLMIPADNHTRPPRTDGIQNARIRATPSIENRHIARVEVIILQALTFL